MGIYGISNDTEHYKAKETELEKMRQARKADGVNQADDQTGKQTQRDEYIKGDSKDKPNGLYKVDRDENGKIKIVYDDPKKAKENAEKEVSGTEKAQAEDEAKSSASPEKEKEPEGPQKAQPDKPEDKPEKCICNTDQVDREIEGLKKEKANLERQIKSVAGNDDKVKEVEKRLIAIQNELGQKDNDTYRRQNASFKNV